MPTLSLRGVPNSKPEIFPTTWRHQVGTPTPSYADGLLRHMTNAGLRPPNNWLRGRSLKASARKKRCSSLDDECVIHRAHLLQLFNRPRSVEGRAASLCLRRVTLACWPSMTACLQCLTVASHMTCISCLVEEFCLLSCLFGLLRHGLLSQGLLCCLASGASRLQR